MQCTKCGNMLPPDYKFCKFCGQVLIKKAPVSNKAVCVYCKKEFDPSFVFCDRCGYMLVSAQQYAVECSKPLIEVKSATRQVGKATKANGKVVLYIDRIEFTPQVKKQKNNSAIPQITPAPENYYYINFESISKTKRMPHMYTVTVQDNAVGETEFALHISGKLADEITDLVNKYINIK